MRDAIDAGLAIEDDQELEDDLCGVTYAFNLKSQIVLEKKEDMKKRGLASPDWADALSLCFAYPVGPREMHKNGDQNERPSNLITDHED